MYDTSHDLSPETRQSIIDTLNEHLADGIDLRLRRSRRTGTCKAARFLGYCVKPVRYGRHPARVHARASSLVEMA